MKYLAKKLAGFVMTMLVVSFLVFAAFAVIPGDPATAMLGTQATPEKLAALREQMGLNEPLLVRFGSWAVNFIQGDFGTSYKYQMSVRSMIAEKIPVTLTLTAMSFLIMVAVSIPVGLFCAHHAGGKVDRIVLIVDQVIMAIPPFFSGILITLLFGLVLHLFTPGGYVSYTTSVTGFLGYLIFPSVAIALPKAAMAIKLLRTSVLSEMKLDYVRTAYSRGNNTKGVLYQHVLRNAIIPVCNFGSQLSIVFILLGLFLYVQPLFAVGILLFSLAVVVQLVTLPVEFNASARAIATISAANISSFRLFMA